MDLHLPFALNSMTLSLWPDISSRLQFLAVFGELSSNTDVLNNPKMLV